MPDSEMSKEAQMVDALIGLVDSLEPMTLACTGYRAKLEAAGYSPTMAEMIAAEVHLALIRKMFEPKPLDAS